MEMMMHETDPDNLVNFTRIAELVVADRLAPTMTRQRVYFLRKHDPNFPDKETKVKRMELFDWPKVRKYFEDRDRSHRGKGWRNGNANGRKTSK